MQMRWLVSLGALLQTAALACGQTPSVQPAGGASSHVGHLIALASHSEAARGQPAPYRPQPGDIILYDDFNKLFHFVFKLARTAPPTHIALVIADKEGKPALLELTGPHTVTAKVVIMDVETRLQSYPGVVMVRRIRAPLSPNQSHELTQFAYAQVGKGFALARVMLQGTPFCPRTGLRHTLFGHTYLDRNRWFCSELVVAACASAQLIDPRACCANCTYPRDLAFDERIDISLLYHPPMSWTGAR